MSALRRARPLLFANPLLALLAATLAVGAPVGAIAAGARLSGPFGALIADPVAARSLAIGLAATGLVGGMALALLAPGPAALGRQLAAAPVSRAALVVGATAAPVACAAAVAAIPVLLFAVSLDGARGSAVVLALAAAVAIGAAAAEAGRLLAGGDAVGAVVFGGAALVWAGAALAAAQPVETGPAAFLAGNVPAAASGAAGAAAASAGVALWLAAAVRRRPARTRGAVSWTLLPIARTPVAAVAAESLKRIGRTSELRAHLVATTLLTIAAAYGFALALGVRGTPLLGFLAGLALTAVAILPSVSLGLLREQRRLVRTSPASPHSAAAAAAGAGMLAGAATVIAVAALSAPVARGDPATLLQLEAAAAFVLGCGAISGALLPWRADRVLQQLAAYGALLGVVLVVWLALGRIADVLALSDDVFAVGAGNAVGSLGLVLAAVSTR